MRTVTSLSIFSSPVRTHCQLIFQMVQIIYIALVVTEESGGGIIPASIDRSPLYCLLISPILPESRGRLPKAVSSYHTESCQQLTLKRIRLLTVPQSIESCICETYLPLDG